MLNILYLVVASLIPMPQQLAGIPPNREGLPSRRIEVVVVKLEEDDDLLKVKKLKSSPKKGLFNRVVARVRSFNRTGKRKPLNY